MVMSLSKDEIYDMIIEAAKYIERATGGTESTAASHGLFYLARYLGSSRNDPDANAAGIVRFELELLQNTSTADCRKTRIPYCEYCGTDINVTNFMGKLLCDVCG